MPLVKDPNAFVMWVMLVTGPHVTMKMNAPDIYAIKLVPFASILMVHTTANVVMAFTK